ncbi:major capsid protein P2 [Oceanibaculum indicum]|uniref:Uncharacterized protein n=1 Tax=Oceanibaculum indicum TaxID=526216 RepID=A0A420WPY9_9PROT|nr:major capsid protein P2 [Oceanibaculum indicum]RKQ73104.1 hypothetical protein BCL74_0877 [Oceanibaculum indicum]
MANIQPDLRPLPSFNAVGAGQTATVSLPTDGIYFSVNLLYAESGTPANLATFTAAIPEIRININGVTQRRMSAAEIITLNALRGETFEAGILPIFFSLPWRPNAVEEDALAWGTADVSTFQIEVDIAAGRTAPTLRGEAYKLMARANMGPIVKVNKYTIPVSAIGTVNTNTLPRTDAYMALHAKSTDIDHIRIKLDGREKLDADFDSIHNGLKSYGWNPQSGYSHVLWDRRNRNADVLSMSVDVQGGGTRQISDFQIDWQMSAATSFVLLTETVGFRNS